jgi:hypothetical protein
MSTRHKIAYFPVPKAACTSLKLAMFDIENGRRYRRKENERLRIQLAYPTASFVKYDLTGLDDYWKFAMVRDPVKRIISAYTNKFDRWTDLITQQIANPKVRDELLADGILPEPPSLIEFSLRIEAYRKHSKPIRHHTEPFEKLLGPDLDFFDKVYCLENLQPFLEDISHRIGRPFEMPHSNASSTADRTMNDAATAALLAYTAPDYAYLSRFYTAPPSP